MLWIIVIATFVDYIHMGSKGIISHVVLGECNYLYLSKGELLCVRDKACSPFNECTTLSPPTNSHTASLLHKKQVPYVYKCVKVIVLWYRKWDWDQLYSTSFEYVDNHLI